MASIQCPLPTLWFVLKLYLLRPQIPMAHNSTPIINLLPGELLTEIFNLATHPKHPPKSKLSTVQVRWDVVPLAVVCRRFHCIATPILYSHLAVSFAPSAVPLWDGEAQLSQSASFRLYRTLQTNPSLREHCRALSYSFYWASNTSIIVPFYDSRPDENLDAGSMAKTLASWLSNTTTLNIYSRYWNWDVPLTAVVRTAALNMPRLKEVALNSTTQIYRGCINQLFESPSSLEHCRLVIGGGLGSLTANARTQHDLRPVADIKAGSSYPQLAPYYSYRHSNLLTRTIPGQSPRYHFFNTQAPSKTSANSSSSQKPSPSSPSTSAPP